MLSLLDFFRARFPAPKTASTPQPLHGALEGELDIPVVTRCGDEETALRARGQYLARQEAWDELSEEIRAADGARRVTGSGLPAAALLATGARADVVGAVEDALREARARRGADLLEGMTALETVLRGHAQQWPVALVVARAHIDIALAWRREVQADCRLNAFAAHMARAAEILDAWCPIEQDAPALAAAHCACLEARPDPRAAVADAYEDLIDLDPATPSHMRELGLQLLPGRFGNHDRLEAEARRTAQRTRDIWGSGAYTLVYLDAAARDPAACARLDPEEFVRGIRDILDRRSDQPMANMLAAHCAVAMRPPAGEDPAASTRARLLDCAGWIVRDHLTELHPVLWDRAARRAGEAARAGRRMSGRGERDALRIIGDLFRGELERGLSVTFTRSGPVVGP